ncbi:class I SAM-dependent methyltransferase [Amycolatopsis rhizosphaerae]|uniref:Class I SAM-dependent methyltransferase n=1 Tax=Amycolatopsis rhizosphaerae TaxID=2053003 RepID=A0A558APM7_9PSEU|nr:class I SAM-dependent methyltransferase [Amycolatopsis rhizosphaerae]TVT26196.1 class I SAM-dependent methyltransferase [Amycolatopsis rhizosphaerae]
MTGADEFAPLRITYRTDVATTATNSQEAARIYDDWAEDYERRILSYGYSTPAVAAGFFGRYVAPGAGSVLDAGAGTGMMGQVLAPLGYHDITGIDISENMLKVAREKRVYRDLRRMELGRRLDFPDHTFAAVVSTGVFAAGHAPPESLTELVRVSRPGGCVIFSVRTDVYVEGGFRDRQDALEREGKWRLLQTSEPFSHLRYEDPGLKVRIFAYRVR